MRHWFVSYHLCLFISPAYAMYSFNNVARRSERSPSPSSIWLRSILLNLRFIQLFSSQTGHRSHSFHSDDVLTSLLTSFWCHSQSIRLVKNRCQWLPKGCNPNFEGDLSSVIWYKLAHFYQLLFKSWAVVGQVRQVISLGFYLDWWRIVMRKNTQTQPFLRDKTHFINLLLWRI